MIEKTLQTTDGKLRVKIPDQLNELTLGQMMALQEKPELNDIEAISILSCIAVETLNNVKMLMTFKFLAMLYYPYRTRSNTSTIAKQHRKRLLLFWIMTVANQLPR
ncbi:MAG: hypothetical protein AAGC65_08215 [Mucilaginibacter sp.]|uniref:hypothetical protein n=1 Tax=Mucilaginibacter sp. TaxID=1882438 RepID=UPI0031AB87CB